ncbi:MAG: SH3 domain-containing protein [Clostridia bacterium]|nr:SH3 domain-containing protein [Clostridia bacterium]
MRYIKKATYVVIMLMLVTILKGRVYASTGKVITDTLKLRKGPTIESIVLDLISMGDNLEVLEKDGDWYKVKFNDKEGYVSAEFLELQDDDEETREILQEEEIIENVPDNQSAEVDKVPVEEDAIEEDVIDQKHGVVLERTSVYITPLINSTGLKTIDKDTEIEIISKTNNWMYIKTQDSMGWIISNKVDLKKVTMDENQENVTEQTNQDEQNEEIGEDTIFKTTKKAYIKDSVVNVRKEASKTSEKVMTLLQNTEITLVGENGDWYKIKTTKKEGYILKSLVSETKIEVTTRQMEEERIGDVSTASVTGENLVEYAKQFLGCRYVYGASGPNTFDCSGFTMFIYKKFGYNLSRTATSQSKEGVSVSKENLKQGDLVVFYDTGITKIGHIGIYIGGGKFIHASSSTGLKCLVTGKSGNIVKVSDLTSGGYLRRYHSAVRIIK